MENNGLPDIQQTKPEIQIPIQQVGVEKVSVPFILQQRYGSTRDIVAEVSLRSDISDQIKGVSMSRFIQGLQPYLSSPLKHFMIKDILRDLKTSIGSINSFIKFEFKLPKNKKSPISNNEFPLFYSCKFEGQLQNETFRFFQGVTIQYSSYCPCSAELCNDLKVNKNINGFPHAQRSFAEVLIEGCDNKYIWLEDIIDLVEYSIKTLPYPIIKREDEQELAKIAASNPIFVEDAIRSISKALNEKIEIKDWMVKCIHEESIHTHEAVAINWKGVPGGFSGWYYL